MTPLGRGVNRNKWDWYGFGNHNNVREKETTGNLHASTTVIKLVERVLWKLSDRTFLPTVILVLLWHND